MHHPNIKVVVAVVKYYLNPKSASVAAVSGGSLLAQAIS
jgi:hypothetical protein